MTDQPDQPDQSDQPDHDRSMTMARTITTGQARRIAAEWQAPGNGFSLLQHRGVISPDLTAEITAEMRTLGANAACRELAALLHWAESHGPGKVGGWGAWDDTPAR